MLAGCFAVASASAGHAQGGSLSPHCPGVLPSDIAVQDACQKVIDVFQFMAPQLGASVTGGNAVLGEMATLGGLGHMSVGIRVNAVGGLLPLVERVVPSTTGAVAGEYPVENRLISMPALDVAVGLFPGFLLPGTRGFGLDALVSVAFIPQQSDQDIDVSLPEGSVRFGFGARLTLLEESILTPAVTATYLRRDLPTLELSATPDDDELSVRQLGIETSQWRVLFGKHLGSFAVSIGGGQDSYDAVASVSAVVRSTGIEYDVGPVPLSQSLTRDNAFIELALDLPPVRLAAEAGRVNGGNIPTFNAFRGARADDALIYGSFGVRVHW